MKILGCDPSLEAFGWCLAELESGSLRFTSAGVIRTAAGQAVRKGDDASIRVQQIYRQLLVIAKRERPDVICVEGLAIPFGRTSFKTVQQCARARTIVDCVAVNLGARLIEKSPQALKTALTGDRKADKLAIITAVSGLYPSIIDVLYEVGSDAEHVADAAAAIHACREGVGL